MKRNRWPRFSMRVVLLVLTLVCVAAWWFFTRPRESLQRQLAAGRSQIHQRDRFWLEACFDETVRANLVTVLGDSRLSHWGSVAWLLVPDSNTIISYGSDGALIIWNRDDGSIRHGFFDVTFAVHATEAGTILFGDGEGKVRSWSIADASLSVSSQDVSIPPNSVCALTSDGRYLLFGPHRGSLSVWDCTTQRALASIDPYEGRAEVDHAEQWEALAISAGKTVILASASAVTEYDILSGEPIASVDLPKLDDGTRASPFDVEIAPDGETLLVADAAGRVMSFDWVGKKFSKLVFKRGGSVRQVTWGSSENTLFLSGGDDVLRLLTWEQEQMVVQPVYRGRATAMSQPNALVLGLHNGRIVIRSGDREARINGGPRLGTTCFAYSPQGDKIALAGRDGQIAIHDTDDWRRISAWPAHEGEILSLVWSPDATQIVSNARDNTVVIWDAESGTERKVLSARIISGDLRPVYDDTGKALALRSPRLGVSVYDTAAFEEQHTVSMRDFLTRGEIMFAANGKQLYAGGSNVTVQVWDLDAAKVVATMGGPTFGYPVKLALDRKGGALFASAAKTVEAFDAKTNASLWSSRVATGRTNSLALHSTKPLLAVGANDGTVVLLDTVTGVVQQQLRIGPTRGEVRQVGFSPDGELLTAAMSNGAVVVMRVPAAP